MAPSWDVPSASAPRPSQSLHTQHHVQPFGDTRRQGSSNLQPDYSKMHFNSSRAGTAEMSEMEAEMMISDLAAGKLETFRTSLIGLGVFSLLLLLVTITRILLDARARAKLEPVGKRGSLRLAKAVHPAEILPLALSIAVAFQVIIFIGLESSTLSSTFVNNCTINAQVALPALFIFGYTLFVFAGDTTIRSLRPRAFQTRSSKATVVCLISIIAALLLTWIPSRVYETMERCFGGVIWWPIMYPKEVLSLLSIMIFAFMIMALIIGFQLRSNVDIETDERIAASRVFIYLLVAIVIHVLVLPFWIEVFIFDFVAQIKTSIVAEITLFSIGIGIGFLHLFLRANASRFVLKPKNTPWNETRRIRLFGPNDLPLRISPPSLIENPTYADFQSEKQLEAGSLYSQDSIEKRDLALDQPLQALSPNRTSRVPSTPRTPRWPVPAGSAAHHTRNKSSYTLFPNASPEPILTPPPVYSMPTTHVATEANVNLPPAPVSKLLGSSQTSRPYTSRNTLWPRSTITVDPRGASTEQHDPPRPSFIDPPRDRKASSASTTTVQIGLQFSLAPSVIGVGGSIPAPPVSPGGHYTEPVPPLPSTVNNGLVQSTPSQTLYGSDQSDDRKSTLDLNATVVDESLKPSPLRITRSTMNAIADPMDSDPRPDLPSNDLSRNESVSIIAELSKAGYSRHPDEFGTEATSQLAGSNTTEGDRPSLQRSNSSAASRLLSGLHMNPVDSPNANFF